MSDPLSIALSGLRSASTKAGAAASNIANAGSAGAREGTEGPKPYTPVDVVDTSVTTLNGSAQGVRSDLVERDPATQTAYSPDSSFADEDGLIAVPNVDHTEEIVDLKYAEAAYKANAAVIRVAGELQDTLLEAFDERV